MTLEDWKLIIGGFGVGCTVATTVAWFFVNSYLRSYLSEKGKNLATREDIAEITRKVEDVKQEVLARHTLRFAALEKRLQAHQEASAHCHNLLRTIHEPEKLGTRLNECQDWFYDNSLYLDPEAREALWSAWGAGQDYYSLGRDPYNPKLMKENWDKIVSAMNVIAAVVGLPPLKSDKLLLLNKK